MLNSTKIKKIFSGFPAVKLVYFFGSRARNDFGPLSDYDFAVYIEEANSKKRFNIKLDLFAELSLLLKTDKVDIVILNDQISPELKYNIINEGKLIYEKEPYRVLVEPRVLNEYFDFHESLVRNGLTKK
ncbi:MAG: nucleotidyltransferase domain-containing protein [Patescibacteria group bacterium]